MNRTIRRVTTEAITLYFFGLGSGLGFLVSLGLGLGSGSGLGVGVGVGVGVAMSPLLNTSNSTVSIDLWRRSLIIKARDSFRSSAVWTGSPPRALLPCASSSPVSEPKENMCFGTCQPTHR